MNGNTPGIGILTATRSDPGSTQTSKPGSSNSIASATSTTSSAGTTTATGSNSQPLSGGAIAGIAIGGAAGLGALALGVFFLFFKKKPAAPTQGGSMAEYTQQEHLQQYAPQAASGPAYAHGHDPYAPKPYPEQQQPVEAPANEAVPNLEPRPTWELPASNH